MERDQAHKQNELLLRIAVALEKGNTPKYNFPPDIPGFEGILDELDNLDSDFDNNVNLSNKELHEGKLHTDDGYQDDDHVHNDYLNDLVTDFTKEQYTRFYIMKDFSFALSDAVSMTNAIYELEYEECLSTIKQALHITGELDIEERIEHDIKYATPTSDNPDPAGYGKDEYTYDNNLRELHCGVVNDSDWQIRKSAYSYEAALDEDLHTKKDCIMDYVTNEFGILGARYTDIIKFAYYLGEPNAPKYDNSNRGYYSCAFNVRLNGHLIQGGKDQLVKGINNEGKEKYFALSFVDQATDYYKRIK